MTTTKTKTNPAEVHAQAVKAIGAWTAELEKARAELTRLESTPAADAATAKRQAADLATAREYAMRCTVALDAAIDRRDAAAAAVVEREAGDLAPEVDAAAAALAQHDARTAELLAPLVKHSGREWAAVDPVQAWRARGGDGRVTVPASARARLEGRLKAVERRRDALLAAARGEDPAHIIGDPSELPASLKLGGVLPSVSLVAREAQAAEQAQADTAHAALLAEAQRQVDAALEALGVDLDVRATDPASEWTDQRGQRWRARFKFTQAQEAAVWDDINGHAERMRALTVVASLAGWDAGTETAAAALPTLTATTDDTGEDQ